jgi:hypothetical protein
MAINSTYALTSSGSWVVPTGVASITVECFGSVLGKDLITATLTDAQSNRSGASYSKSTNISVTAGQTFFHNIGASGGNTWFNTVNSAPVVGTDTSATSCLSVGGNTASASQVAANIGDTKYAGGAGNVSTGTTLSGTGGNAGPNGAGAASGVPYSNTPIVVNSTNYFIGSGGGANGGSQGSLGVIPYGRTGSGATAGSGAGEYWDGANYFGGTTDATLSSDYLGISPQLSTTNYGARGGSAVSVVDFCGSDAYSYNGNNGFIVITLNSPTQKSVVFMNNTSGSFTVPADFVALVSLETSGVGGIGTGLGTTSGGGGGGGAYAKTLGSSVTASITAGSTVVYYSSSTTLGSGLSSWLRISTNSAPSSVTDGCLAQPGANAVFNTGAAGGLGSTSVGDIKFNGGQGGNGWASTRNNGGGGGGGAGPTGNGGIGGIGFATTANRGAGGGGSINSAGNAGLTAAGGAGATGLGTGGAGATASASAGAGTNGGGSGGGFGNSFGARVSPTYYNVNSIYGVLGGQGGGAGTISGRGGNGGGSGVVVFTYSTVAVTASNGNFFLMF